MIFVCSQKGAAVVTEELDEEDEEDIDFDDDEDFEGLLCSLSLSSAMLLSQKFMHNNKIHVLSVSNRWWRWYAWALSSWKVGLIHASELNYMCSFI